MKKGNKRRRFVTASVGLLMLMTLVLVACGGNQKTSSPTTATPTVPARTPTPTATSVVITSPIVGTYAVTITQADIPNDSLAVPGHWMITFTNDGRYTVILEGAPHSVGTYQVKNQQLTIINDSRCIEFGQSEGISDAGTGTYTWMLNGKMLTLKAVTDTCSPRKLVLSTHPWVKQD